MNDCHICGRAVVPSGQTVRFPSCECHLEIDRLRADHQALATTAALWKREHDKSQEALATYTEGCVKLQAERDAARAQLALIGERAVIDFDDTTVGAVDAAVKEPARYKDWVEACLNGMGSEREAKLRAEVKRLTMELSDLKGKHDASLAQEIISCDAYMEEVDRARDERDAAHEEINRLRSGLPAAKEGRAGRTLTYMLMCDSMRTERDSLLKFKAEAEGLMRDLQPTMNLAALCHEFDLGVIRRLHDRMNALLSGGNGGGDV